MENLIVAYLLIFVVLVGYGWSLYQRTRETDQALRAREKK